MSARSRMCHGMRFVLLYAMACLASPVIVWVPSYSIPQCQERLQQDFGGIGMKDAITYLGLQMYAPSGGSIYQTGCSDNDIIWFRDWGHQHGVKVLLCIHNCATGQWDWGIAVNAFRDNKSALVNALVSEVNRLNLDGVDLDLEGVGSFNGDADAYISFATELTSRLHAVGKVVTVASFANQWNAPNWDWWGRLFSESNVDGICSMGYDGSSRSTDYGPQVEHATAAPGRFMVGMPGWVDTWMGYGVIDQLDWVVDNGTVGLGIWDCELRAGSWRTAEVWRRIKTIHDRGNDQPGPFTLTVNASNGRVEISPRQDTYPKGTVVTLTAVADEGYSFLGWSGDVSGGDASTTVTMNANRTVTAQFSKDGELLVNGDFSAGATGWNLETWGNAAASGGVSNGAYVVRTQAIGAQPWDIALVQGGITLTKGKTYAVQFTASATAAATIEVNLGMTNEPYTSYLVQTYKAELTTSPRTFSFTFTMTENTDANSRLEFNSGLARIDWTLDDVSLRVDNASPALTMERRRPPVTTLNVSGYTAHLFLPEAGRITIDLLDLQGKLVRHVAAGRFGAGGHRLSLSTLPAGAYLIALDNGKERMLRRWCVVR